ncbi:MAG TPA: hypothetical protein VGL86_25015 [Polyangia bacterium]
MRRGLPTLLIVVGAAATLVIAWRVQRHVRAPAPTTIADARQALVDATQTLARAPGEPAAAWDRAVALRALGLTHLAADAFEMIAAQGDGGRSLDARTAARALRDDERARALAQGPQAGCASFDAALAAATGALQAGDAGGAEDRAFAVFAAARRDGCDARDRPRRALILAASAARVRGETALAGAYTGEARLVMP